MWDSKFFMYVSKLLHDYLNCNMLQIIFEFSVVISKDKIGTRWAFHENYCDFFSVKTLRRVWTWFVFFCSSALLVLWIPRDSLIIGPALFLTGFFLKYASANILYWFYFFEDQLSNYFTITYLVLPITSKLEFRSVVLRIIMNP